MATVNPRGRPPASSCEVLQEAAFELFLENGYAGTTVAQITQRAGVSRATFFNYFAAKSDVFWIDLDESLARLPRELRETGRETPVMAGVLAAVVASSESLAANRVPWALTHHTMIGSVGELQRSATARLGSQARIVSGFVAGRIGRDQEATMLAQCAGYASVGAAIAAAQTWAAAGPTRGDLGPYLAAALAPVCDGLQGAIDTRSAPVKL